MRNCNTACLCLALALAFMLGACTKSGTDTQSSQVVAKVNGHEITVSQLNFVLSRVSPEIQQGSQQAQRNALNKLIDIDLLAKKAVQQKLDRDPEVLHAIQYAKEQVLAKAYLDNVMHHSGLNRPSEEEVHTYYDKHPELFKKRRVYHLRQISIEQQPGRHQVIEDDLAQAKSIKAFEKRLQSQNIRFVSLVQVKAAEDLPLALLHKLGSLKKGDIVDISNGGNTSQLVQLVGSEEQPLSEKQAAPLIERYLVNERHLQLAQMEVKKLRGTARIKFMGRFAGTPLIEQAAAPAPLSDEKTGNSDFMDKGLSGLK